MFTSSDPLAKLPTTYLFSSGNQGVHGFTVTLNTSGSQSITATDASSSSIKGSLNGINVSAVDSLFGTGASDDLLSDEQENSAVADANLPAFADEWAEDLVEMSIEVLPLQTTVGRMAATLFEQPEALSTPVPRAAVNTMALTACSWRTGSGLGTLSASALAIQSRGADLW